MNTSTAGWSLTQVVELLDKVSLFQGLPRPDLERIAHLVRGKSFAEGELLFREGDPGDRFYIVYRGAVEILKEKPRGEHDRLAVKRSGEAFGEMALLTDAPRSASVRAIEPTQCLAVAREDFDNLLGGESIAVRLMRGLAKALRAMDVRLAAAGGGGGGGDALRQFSKMVQKGFAPRHVPQVEGYELAAGLVNEENGGGRAIWDAFQAGNRAILSIMDVRGSGGLPSGYLLGVARTVLHEIGRADSDVTRLLPRLNEAMNENVLEGVDECVQVGLLRLDPAGVAYGVAGDQPGVIVRTDGSVETLVSHGPPLGILPRFDYGETRVSLNSGDVLLFFSELDGGVVMGAGDLVKQRAGDPAATLAVLLQTALTQVLAQSGGQDVAFTVVKRL